MHKFGQAQFYEFRIIFFIEKIYKQISKNNDCVWGSFCLIDPLSRII